MIGFVIAYPSPLLPRTLAKAGATLSGLDCTDIAATIRLPNVGRAPGTSLAQGLARAAEQRLRQQHEPQTLHWRFVIVGRGCPNVASSRVPSEGVGIEARGSAKGRHMALQANKKGDA